LGLSDKLVAFNKLRFLRNSAGSIAFIEWTPELKKYDLQAVYLGKDEQSELNYWAIDVTNSHELSSSCSNNQNLSIKAYGLMQDRIRCSSRGLRHRCLLSDGRCWTGMHDSTTVLDVALGQSLKKQDTNASVLDATRMRCTTTRIHD
jgi:hypothetical protein